MSVTTSKQINRDRFVAALGGSASLTIVGAELEEAAAKTITVAGVTDAAIAAAVATAASQFVDYAANRAALAGKAAQAIAANNTFLALTSPTNAQTLAQVQRLTRENNAIIKILLGDLSDTAGT